MTKSKWCNNKACGCWYRPEATFLCPFCLEKLIRDLGHGETFDIMVKGLILKSMRDVLKECLLLGIIDQEAAIKALPELQGG